MGGRPPAVRLFADELIVDSFAGGGGASLGIEMALGRSPDIAINHDREAISMHAVNHPGTRHFCEDVWAVDPIEATLGRPVGLMWLSPDCKHFSKAKGGKPVEKKIRGLAWIAVKWARSVKPRVIALENVEEFEDWGPLLEDGKPCPLRKGLTFRRFKRALERCGYKVEHDELVAADFGAPTTRRRLFLIARCDGQPIVWPEATHGKGRALAWRAASECIDWSLPCPSIFERARPLAENTLKRIARGIRKYVIESAQPFIVGVGGRMGQSPERGVDRPVQTVTGKGDAAIVTPYLARIGQTGGGGSYVGAMSDPVSTITSKAEHLLLAPYMVPRYGEREGQEPRAASVERPMATIVPTANHASLVTAFMAKHYGGHETPGSSLKLPLDTVTAKDHNAIVASSLVKLKGTCRDGQPVTVPLHTVQASGFHYAEVRAFLMKYHATGGQWNSLWDPAPTVVANDSIGLVTVAGERYQIADIGMRMLQPRELFRAQGFPDTYRIDADASGKPFTKSAQVRMCGNSVCPPVAAAIVRAQFGIEAQEVAA